MEYTKLWDSLVIQSLPELGILFFSINTSTSQIWEAIYILQQLYLRISIWTGSKYYTVASTTMEKEHSNFWIPGGGRTQQLSSAGLKTVQSSPKLHCERGKLF